jgi:hypothetical protein
MKFQKYKIAPLICLLLTVLMFPSCASRDVKVSSQPAVAQKKHLALMGYTIQAGAFARVQNALRLTEKLKDRGLDATYFKAPDGLFKVRFGNFTSKDQARVRAESLQLAGVIEEFYIVLPEESPAAKQRQLGVDYLRESLVKSAYDFIGVPYLWGGLSADTGFDCSGLTMTVYQLNGLNLPRHSRTQYDAGDEVSLDELQKGDLVFFATRGRGRISHVGIYIGTNKFIHAPAPGKKICINSLKDAYYAKRFMGARTYLL